jgi:hypothetical protein
MNDEIKCRHCFKVLAHHNIINGERVLCLGFGLDSGGYVYSSKQDAYIYSAKPRMEKDKPADRAAWKLEIVKSRGRLVPVVCHHCSYQNLF